MVRVWRQWRVSAGMAISSAFSDGLMFVLGYAVSLLRLGVLLALWRIVLADTDVETSMPLESVLTYTLLASAFSGLINVRTELPNAFWQGTITNHFHRPMGLVSQFAAPALGTWLVEAALFSLPLFLIAPLLGVQVAPASALAAVLFPISLAMSVSVGLALEFSFVSLTVALEQPIWLIEFVRRAVQGLLAGAVIPLALMPWGLGDALAWLPFAATAWAPLAIYTGSGDALGLLATQAVWATALWPIALWGWRSGREKMVGYGG